MQTYITLHFKGDPEISEIAIALLQELPILGFEITNEGFSAFLTGSDWQSEIAGSIQDIANNLDLTYHVEQTEDRNWNQVWEDQFQPVLIDNRVAIRASFHPHFPDTDYELSIHPKMAFGTGHHETTTMMIQEMLQLDFKQKKVLDYGCGTGILGILASKLGATSVDGVDNEWPAYESTVENCQINAVNNMKAIFGTLNDVANTGYDIVLANINRNIILETLQALVSKTASGSILLFSGVLDSDQAIMETSFTNHGLSVNHVRNAGQWLCFHCVKNN